MSQAGMFMRVGKWFRSVGRTGGDGRSLPPVDREGLLRDPASATAGADQGSASFRTLSRRRQRELALERLEAGYLQVVGLIESIHAHLQTQDRRSQEIAGALGRLAETTQRLPEIADSQTQQLGAIASQLEAGNDRARRWEQTLFELPRLAEGQREALDAIGRQLDVGRQTEGQMVQTLDGLRSALDSWSASSSASTQALQQLQEAAARREERLETALATQNKRFGWFLALAAMLALAALGTSLVILLR
ncbi:MAG: hypothetical protein IID40_08805 [Planctomycetes bacterium]|nr:hypothetical protein [Planctomycetota bacterium]